MSVASLSSAVVDRAIAHPLGPREGLTRHDIDLLRIEGATQGQVVALITDLLGAEMAAHIARDLDHYGPWSG